MLRGDNVKDDSGSPARQGLNRRVPNLRLCEHLIVGWDTQGDKGEFHVFAVFPSSRRGKYLQAARKDKWSPRGSPHLSRSTPS